MEHQRRADLMLLLATSFWGISNCLTAICLRDMQPLTLNAFRFLTAFVVLGFVFRKNVFHASRETVKYSIVVGLSLVVVYTSVTYGVIYTSVSNAGFICALSVVTTPILEFIVYRKKAGEEIRRFDDLMSYRLSADDAERDAQARVRRYHLPVRSGVLLRRPDGHGKGRGE